MAKKIQIHVIESFTVKPSSPTPDKHRIYKLSFLDQFCPANRTPLLFFYRSNLKNISETSQLLKQSLSQALTKFHHFSGRLIENVSIECNDEGAEFEVTRVNCPISEILENPELATLTQLVPSQAVPREALLTSPLLLVQANFFDCGGIVIGVCLSHKAGDASTLSNFLSYWSAATAKSEAELALIPQFVASTSIFPPLDSSAFSAKAYPESKASEKIRVKRLVFDSQRIDNLRSKLAVNSTVPNPTRVEAVSALIWKCLIDAFSNAMASSDQLSSFFIQTANVRRRLDPPLPENSVGNLLWFFQAEVTKGGEESETEVKDLVVLLREGVDGLKRICKNGIPPEALSHCVEAMARRKKNADFPGFSASSWCRFPLYGVDFGWGKPLWVCSPYSLGTKNAILMMDTRDGDGIEVALWLGEEVMKCFERNHELLAFASLYQM